MRERESDLTFILQHCRTSLPLSLCSSPSFDNVDAAERKFQTLSFTAFLSFLLSRSPCECVNLLLLFSFHNISSGSLYQSKASEGEKERGRETKHDYPNGH